MFTGSLLLNHRSPYGRCMQRPDGIIAQSPVGTLHATSLQYHEKRIHGNHFTEYRGSLATVIRSYKSAVSKNVHLIDPDFSWQRRYYDHLIRSDRELYRIRNYIINNPVN